MQNEALRGNTPAAAPGAVAGDVRLCLACLHWNRGGEQSCEVCGTSLYLTLCRSCEAVNGPGALHCHGCGAALGTEASDEPSVAASKTTVTGIEASEKPAAAPSASEEPAAAPSASEKSAAAPAASRTSVAPTEASEKPDKPLVALPASRTNLARIESSDKRAATPPARRVNRTRLALSLAALVAVAAFAVYQHVPRTAQVARSQEGRIVKSASVESSERAARVEQPSKPPVRTQAPSTQGSAAASAAGSSANVGPAPSRPYTRVTHTRPGDADSTPPAAAVTPAAVVAPAAPDTNKNSDGRCSEQVIALGLCNISTKKGGSR